MCGNEQRIRGIAADLGKSKGGQAPGTRQATPRGTMVGENRLCGRGVFGCTVVKVGLGHGINELLEVLQRFDSIVEPESSPVWPRVTRRHHLRTHGLP